MLGFKVFGACGFILLVGKLRLGSEKWKVGIWNWYMGLGKFILGLDKWASMLGVCACGFMLFWIWVFVIPAGF